MQRHCRVEVDRVLPAGLRDELDRRFGPLEISDRPEGAVVGGLALDQAGLRALLGALWDAGVQVTAVTTAAADQPAAGPRAVGDGTARRRAGDGAAEPLHPG
jgi:hypothetical protein